MLPDDTVQRPLLHRLIAAGDLRYWLIASWAMALLTTTNPGHRGRVVPRHHSRWRGARRYRQTGDAEDAPDHGDPVLHLLGGGPDPVRSDMAMSTA
ncbi:hypothetical protein [Brevundimonas sp.]|uniref:hypothetical protein n=1 Tax=Brevundimonas sp. TaxID=1871086 RepID=UPI003AFFF5E8